MKKLCLSVLCLVSVYVTAGEPRVAVWDPVRQTPEARFQFDFAAVSNVVAALNAGGSKAALLTVNELADAKVFSAERFDALVIVGQAVPRKVLEPAKRFAEAGGVLVALDASVPFLLGVEDVEGRWRLSPQEPAFAWQTDALLKLVGQKYQYKPELHSQGVVHTPTALLKRYLPQAKAFSDRLESRWVVPVDGGEYFPLVLSTRSDKSVVPGGAYIARKGKYRAVIVTAPILTQGTDVALWPCSKEFVGALGKIARDLREGKLELPAKDAVSFRDDLPMLALDRAGSRSIEPEGAVPVVRWGLFNGSILDTGAWVGSNGVLRVGLGERDKFPGALAPGASVRLEVPELKGKGPFFVRVRGAYLKSSPVLEVRWGERVLWREELLYVTTKASGNHSQNLAGMPNEFTRLVFVPQGEGAKELVLANSGEGLLYFDAVQVEERPKGAYERCIGLGIGQKELFPYDAELTKGLGGLRMSMRTQRLGPPDDPKRFELLDKLFYGTAAMNGVVQPILEGTPAWAAISEERREDAVKAKRPTTVPPDPVKYAEIVRDVARRYGKNIGCFEVWNEADITQFYRGTPDEYATLFLGLVPVIRKEAPHAKIMPSGMAGYHEGFISTLFKRGVYAQADMVAFHPYAGKTAGWDVPYGLTEGSLFSKGIGLEIFCNESGFPYNNAEWFQPPPNWTPEVQRDYLNVAMARLLANGLAKVSVFNAGGDEHPYGLINGKGEPRPAFEVIRDYAQLQSKGARRLDVSMTAADGSALKGVYVAGSVHGDGRLSVVVNPAECEELKPVADVSLAPTSGGGWVSFFGKVAQGEKGVGAVVTPDVGKAAGYYYHVIVDVARTPVLEVAADGDWELVLKAEGQSYPAVVRGVRQGARVDLTQLLPKGFKDDVEVSFRVHEVTRFDKVVLRAPEKSATQKQLSVRLLMPDFGRRYESTAKVSMEGKSLASVPVKQSKGALELMVPVSGRMMVELKAD